MPIDYIFKEKKKKKLVPRYLISIDIPKYQFFLRIPIPTRELKLNTFCPSSLI